MKVRTSVRELSLGSVATIVGYDKAYGGYIGKLIAMGLMPGTKFVVLGSLTQENSVIMLLLEKVIELSKPEANALCVEEITEEEA
ncbi:MAG: FeoA family protein [Xenococcus sp. MO_188.B8]|nr:FeoA family protein [Xenococcus sp. MO_188.B8]